MNRYAFWTRGRRVEDVTRYAAEMERRKRGASERLFQCMHIPNENGADWTIAIVDGEDWREYMLHQSDWAQMVEGGLMPSPQGGITRHQPKKADS